MGVEATHAAAPRYRDATGSSRVIRDEELAARAKAGEPLAVDALVHRFTGLAYAIAGDYFALGSDRDDLRQEALIGLWKAVRDYDPKVAGFNHFAQVCIRRQVITAVKTATRLKHRPLTEAVRTGVGSDGEEVAMIDLQPAPGEIVQTLAAREEIADLAHKIRVDLSPLEAHCLLLFGNGLNYVEIGKVTGGDEHTVDRAITRARWKLLGQGPLSQAKRGRAPRRKAVYSCPSCGGATVKRKQGRGRPPRCNVCTLRLAA